MIVISVTAELWGVCYEKAMTTARDVTSKKSDKNLSSSKKDILIQMIPQIVYSVSTMSR